MTKKIFKSIMFVCALVLTVGLAAVMGILYSNFDGQMRKELSKEAAYLAYCHRKKLHLKLLQTL